MENGKPLVGQIVFESSDKKPPVSLESYYMNESKRYKGALIEILKMINNKSPNLDLYDLISRKIVVTLLE